MGTVVTTLELRCSRCLEPFTLPVNAAFDLRYLPEGAGLRREERRRRTIGRGRGSRETTTSRRRSTGDEEIDLAELMREQFYLALPMKPLCSQDCKGLCPQCGDKPEYRDVPVPAYSGKTPGWLASKR